jgi:hypothetical protein
MVRTLRLLRWKWQNRRRAWVVKSKTYVASHDGIVGMFTTRRAAERWASTATPPVTDAVIEEWCVGVR